MKLRHLTVALALTLACATTKTPAENAVRRYLAAASVDEALSVLSPTYRLRFGTAESEGMAREQVAQMLASWDFPLHPRHEILDLRANGNTVIATVHEENDFSRMLGFPGWTATSTFVVDDSGRIASQLYVPREGQPDWKSYAEEPVRWIRANDPAALERIYPNGKLARSPENAAEWVRLLRAWRQATGKPDPLR